MAERFVRTVRAKYPDWLLPSPTIWRKRRLFGRWYFDHDEAFFSSRDRHAIVERDHLER